MVGAPVRAPTDGAAEGAVELDDVGRVLEIYVEAMLGRPAAVRPLDDVAPGGERHVDLEGVASAGRPTTDGTAFYLPSRMARFAVARANFVVYRMAVLHQVGGVLFGTYRPGAERFAEFFAGFDEPHLARALFARLEGARIDAALADCFRGVGRDLLLLIDDALEALPAAPPRLAAKARVRRPDTRQAAMLELSQALLVAQRARLAPTGEPDVEEERLPVEAAALLRPGARAADTRYAVRVLYSRIASLRPGRVAGAADPNGEPARADDEPQARRSLDVPGLAHHGDPAPERVELVGEWAELAEELQRRADAEPGPLASGLLDELQLDEFGVLSLQDGDLSGTTGMPLTDLDAAGVVDAEAGAARDDGAEPVELDPDELVARLEELSARLATEREAAGLDGDREQVFYYDEWDDELDRYRRRWCHLRERTIQPSPPGASGVFVAGVGGADAASPDRFVDETRRLHADLLRRVRRQFELLKPAEFRRVRRLIEGEELDLDRVVEAHVDRRVGRPPDGAVYMSRRRERRDVAAAFLLDMSASTDAEAPVDQPAMAVGREPEPEFVGVFDDFDWPDDPQPHPPGRRVIDIEKESLVLMADALETLGDEYAIYGFSGFGRKEVEFFVAKEFDDALDRDAEDRIAAMEPKRSTRMGPAIRHTAAKLHARDAKVKVLLILSDGYPQDFDYGSNRASRAYGIRDTMMALRETERRGISTFCITVDPAGHDYLREMCPERRYLVIDEIAALPSQLPKVYRGLTA